MKIKRSNFFIQKVIPVVGFIIMVYTLFSLSKVVWRNYQVEKETTELEEEIVELEEENQKFSNMIAYFKTDAYREKEARQRLGYKKPGEEVVLVPDVGESSVTVTEAKKELPRTTSQAWWDFFFKVRE